MYVEHTPGNKILLIADVRFKADRDTESESQRREVMHDWKMGRAALGRAGWNKVSRMAVYDYGQDVEVLDAKWSQWAAEQIASPGKKRNPKTVYKHALSHQRAELRAAVRQTITDLNPELVFVLQSRSTEVMNKDNEDAAAVNHSGTLVWSALDHPDGLSACDGSIWGTDRKYMGILNPSNYEWVHGVRVARALRAGESYVRGRLPILLPDPTLSSWIPDDKMTTVLSALRASSQSGNPIAVDIESYSHKNLITAINLSDGVHNVSVPWDAFAPLGQDWIEPGVLGPHERLVREILLDPTSPKVYHNYAYDVPFLHGRGIMTAGQIHDTMAMHGVLYNQFPHDLQHCVTMEFLAPPWKSLFKPRDPALAEGVNRHSAEYYILDPLALREYGTNDGFYTAHLFKGLWRKLA